MNIPMNDKPLRPTDVREEKYTYTGPGELHERGGDNSYSESDQIGEVEDRYGHIDETTTETTKDSPYSGMKSRKLLFSLFIAIFANLFLYLGYITAGIWAQVSVGVVVAYLTGNIAQTAVNKRGFL